MVLLRTDGLRPNVRLGLEDLPGRLDGRSRLLLLDLLQLLLSDRLKLLLLMLPLLLDMLALDRPGLLGPGPHRLHSPLLLLLLLLYLTRGKYLAKIPAKTIESFFLCK